MGLYKLVNTKDNTENSPTLLLDDEIGSIVLWIGRQVTATVGNIGKFPD